MRFQEFTEKLRKEATPLGMTASKPMAVFYWRGRSPQEGVGTPLKNGSEQAPSSMLA
jgi:hypothetical protein